MVHGNPGWSFMFRRLIAGLGGFRRLALDHLGLGLSSRPGPGYGYRLEDRLGDFSRWLDGLGPEGPVHLVVHDWGGPIGLGWAAENPDRVASLTIMNTGLRRPEGFRLPARLAAFRLAAPLGRLLAVRLNLFALGVARFGTARPMAPEAREGFLAPYLVPAHREALAGFVADIPLGPGHPSHRALSRIDQGFGRLAQKPVLLAWGLRDFVFSRAFLDDFRRRRPEARVLALPRAGHCLLEDEPEAVLRALRAFLEDPGGPPP
jgi:haloalkane dehalogenase